MGVSKQSRAITVAGASGNVGKAFLDALVAEGLHKVSIITRPDSKALFPASITVHRGDYKDENFLKSILVGQEVLVVTVGNTALDVQEPLFRAAAQAGIPWVVPCEYGCDLAGTLNEHTSLMTDKIPLRTLIEELGVSSWIGVVCNPWFDFCMRFAALGINPAAKTALLQGSGTSFGTTKANFTTIKRTGESLAAVLGLPEEELAQYRNDWVFFSSFHVTQRDVLESALRVTGTDESAWTITERKTEDIIKESKEKIANGNRMAGVDLLIALVFAEGMGGDYNAKVVDYKKLGLAPEDLDEVIGGAPKESAVLS